jgi:hypothetical protein
MQATFGIKPSVLILKSGLSAKKENWHCRSSASFVEFLKLWSFVRDYLGMIVPPSVVRVTLIVEIATPAVPRLLGMLATNLS